MPRRVLPHLNLLLSQINGIVGRYRHMLDDDLLFGSGVQIPQVATIFDAVGDSRLTFSGEDLTLAELLTLIAYRYGLEAVRVIGHGGYAIVLSVREGGPPVEQRRVMRLVPEHHVRSVVAFAGEDAKEFDVRLDEQREPIRDAAYPLLLSDLFLMPRHTTRLAFRDADGERVYAAGYPAKLHCQLLPEVRAFNHPRINPQMAREAGNMLEAALATLGVNVADAHGGNGGALLGQGGQPLLHTTPDGHQHYVPVVIDYGYYAPIGPRGLAEVLVRHGVTAEQVRACLAAHDTPVTLGPWPDDLPRVIAESGLPRSTFGRLLLGVEPPVFDPMLWVSRAEHHWLTIKERTYPPLLEQARLSRLYPDYDEVIFPQRIEEYTFTLDA